MQYPVTAKSAAMNTTVTAIPEEIKYEDDIFLIRLAREIAINHYPLKEVLRKRGILSPNDPRWLKISRLPRFHTILENEISNWQSATNTHERTKLKAAAMIEEWLPEANSRLNDLKENLPAKVELAKLITKIAGMGIEKMGIEGEGGTKVSININLGADQKLGFNKEVTPKVISAEAVDM